MRYFISFISLVIIYFLANGVSVIIRKKPQDEETNLVMLPKFVLIVGILCSSVFLIPTVITLFAEDKKMLFLSAFFAAFSLLGVALIVAYINCRIVFNEDDFTYKNFLGIKRTIKYKDLTAIQGKNKDIKLFAGKYIIRVDEGATNNKRFVSHAKKQYRKYYDGKALPTLEKKDLFNNHVENPGEFIFLFGMLAVFCLGFTIFIGCMSIPKKETDFARKTVSVDKYEVSDENLLFYDTAGNTYRVKEYASVILNANEFIENLNSKPDLNLLVLYNEKADEPFYIVSSIDKDATEQYLSFDIWRKNEWKTNVFIIGISLIIDLLMFLFIWFTIYVGRNPHKFSDRVLHLFYKPGYIHRD